MNQTRLRVAFFKGYPMVDWYCNEQPTLFASKSCPTPGLAVETSSIIAVKRADKSMSDLFDFFKIFSVDLWILIGCIFLCFILIGLFIKLVEYRLGLRRQLKTTNFMWRFLRFQLIQWEEGFVDFRTRSDKILMIVFALAQCSIVISLFQSSILTSIVRLRPREPFSLDQLPSLLERKRYSIVTTNLHSWYFEAMNTTNHSPFYELRHAIQQNPIIEKKTKTEALDSIADGDKLVIMQEDENIYFSIRHYCHYVYMKSPFPSSDKRFMMQKGHPLLPQINQAILVQKMKILRIYRKYTIYRTRSQCNWQPMEPSALSLVPYFGVLILFITGTLLSFVVFSFEMFKKRLTSK
ncbi:hypothetical protein M3Y97_00946400 [Aphelenchoides bicaudatus]|nr:hypothetical protein M3Y97_00946400 [Aphelenchoides bicaudatus]